MITRRRMMQLLAAAMPAACLPPAALAAQARKIAAGPFTASWDSLKQYRAPDWFRDAKFGIWAHWTAQCVPEQGDWYARRMYLQGDPAYDFHVTTDRDVAPVEYNYRSEAELIRQNPAWQDWKGEQPGTSAFLRDGDRVYHSYSSYGRGLDALLATNNWLDITPFGRGEGWDGMPDLKAPVRHHDRYDP